MEKLVFVHIPRCGGTTLIREFNKYLGKEKVCHDKEFRYYRHETGLIICSRTLEKQYPSAFDVNTCDLICGHFSIDKYKHLGWKTVTFLRNPVDRLISYYNVFLKENPRVQFKDFVMMNSNYILRTIGNDLKRFAFVGVTEHFDKSIEKMNKMFNIDLPVPMPITNHHRRKKVYKPTGEERAFILRHNGSDMEIYKRSLLRLDID
jgi:hypothetical protein